MAPRAWSVFVVVAMAFTTLPLVSSAEAPTISANQEDHLLVGADANLSIRPDGNGWGRIVLEATEDVALQFSLTHDTIEDLDWGGHGEAIYRGGANHTFIHFYSEGKGAFSTDYWFHWWGDPHYGWWPQSGRQFGHCHCSPVELSAGERAVLVVADNVGGYTITITGDGQGAGQSVDWSTGENPDMLVAAPFEQRGLHAGSESLGARERSWTTSWDVSAGDVLSVAGWNHRSGAGVTAAVYLKHELGWGTASPSPVGFPGFSLSSGGPGGSSGSKSTRIGPASESGTYDFFRLVTDVHASTQDAHEGAQFLVLPTGPLA